MAETLSTLTTLTNPGLFLMNGATSTTISAPASSNITLTLPSTTDTLVGRATTDTLSNKSLVDASTLIVNSGTPSKEVGFSLGGATASTETTLTFGQTANRALTFPDATDTLVARNTTDTLTNKTIASGSGNTVTAELLATTGASVNVGTAAPPTTGQVLTATGATTATWQTPTETILTGTVTTVSATPTTIITFATTAATTYTVTARLAWRQTVPSSTTQAGGFIIDGVFFNESGAATQIGASLRSVSFLPAAATESATILGSGANVIVQVTGVAATTIDWSATLEVTPNAV